MEIASPFSLLVAAACADGSISDSEMQVLRRKASQFNVTASQLAAMVELARGGQLRLTYPSDPKERQRRLDDLLDVICADGRVDASERKFILKYATLLGGVPDDLNQKIRERLNRATSVSSTPTSVAPAKREEPAPRPTPPKAAGAPETSMPATVSYDKPMAAPSGPSALDFAPGPVQLPSGLPPPTDLPPVTFALVKQIVQFDGRAEAEAYVEKSLLVPHADAVRIIDRMLSNHPDIKPGSNRIKIRPK